MKGARIICVESYASLQVARRMILERAGFEVQIAESPSQALAKAAEQAFDVAILCDSLGDNDAERLAQDLKTISPTTRILVLNSTGIDSPEILLASIRAALRDGRPVSVAHQRSA